MPASKVKLAIAAGPEGRGLHRGLRRAHQRGQAHARDRLKYYAGKPVIEKIERVSRPGLRIYKGRDDIPARHERAGRGHRLHLPRRDDRPARARDRRGRRSPLHRGLRETRPCPESQNTPSPSPTRSRSRSTTTKLTVKGPLGTLDAGDLARRRGEARRPASSRSPPPTTRSRPTRCPARCARSWPTWCTA